MIDVWKHGIPGTLVVMGGVLVFIVVVWLICTLYEKASDTGKALMMLLGIALVLFGLLPLYVGSFK